MNSFVVDGVRLAYRVDGPADALPVVLSNSLGTDLRMWDPQLPALSKHLRVVRYDSRGHGRSDVPPGPYTIERLGRDLLALLDHLEIERAYVCGLSLGGMVALWLAAHHPHRVDRAVFANTAAKIGTAESWNVRIEAVREGGMPAIRDMVVTRFLSEAFRRRKPDVECWVGDMLEATPPEGYIASCAALRDADLSEVITTIRVPSLIIASALDEATPPTQSRELHTAILGSKLVVLDEAAHLSNLEQPDAFNCVVLGFLTHS